MTFDLAFALSLVPSIARGAVTTVWIALASAALAVVVGFALELARRSGRAGRWTMPIVVDFLRITPILAQLYFLYFVLPYYGVFLPAVAVGILGLGAHYGGYLAEVFKAGIDQIPRGQIEGGQALGLKRWQLIAFILAPQVVRNIAPPAANQFLAILKSTPYLAVLAVPEMLGVALDHASDSFRYVEPMLVVGLLFFLFCLLVGQAVHAAQRRLAGHQR